jgi:SAM-dependent methyltransferase
MQVSLERHNVEIHENRRHWERTPLLRKVYSQFGREIAKRVDHTQPGLVVELGSGMGHIKEHLPDCITTDLFPNPWLDRVEDAYNLTFAAGTVSHMILFDVWHHLEYPGTALREFYRVLTEYGKVIIFDPAMGLLGRVVFGAFHHEPLGLSDEIQWEVPGGLIRERSGYYAAQGNASRVFGSNTFREQLRSWRVAEVTHFSALAYLGTGGFRGPQLYPMAALPMLNRVDSFLSRFPSLASRMLVVLEKQAGLEGKSES